MSKHTPEPEPLWEVVGEGRISTGYVDDIIEVRAGARTDSIARMIVACVNACRGVNPEAVPDLLEACKRAARSEHHPACKCCGEYAANPECYCTCHVQACAAAVTEAEKQG